MRSLVNDVHSANWYYKVLFALFAGAVLALAAIGISKPPCARAASCPVGETAAFSGNITIMGGTAFETTLSTASSTVDRIIYLPDASDVLVGRATTDTLTNKTFNNNTTFNDNAKIALGTAGADANLYSDGTDILMDLLTGNAFRVNAATTNNAVVDIQVPSTGDPVLFLGGAGLGTNEWYIGVDNSASTEPLFVGTGTAVGTNGVLELRGPGGLGRRLILDGRTTLTSAGEAATLKIAGSKPTLANAADATYSILSTQGQGFGWTYTGATTVTTHRGAYAHFSQVTNTQSGGAVTVNNISGIYVEGPKPDTSVTYTNTYLYYGASAGGFGGTGTSVYGMFIENNNNYSNAYGVAIEAQKTRTLWLAPLTDPTTAPAGIFFGISADTNLYRAAANVLHTDDSIRASINVLVGATSTSPSGGSYSLILSDGTAPTGLAATTAGLYADSVDGVTELFGIDSAGTSAQLTPHPAAFLEQVTTACLFPWAEHHTNPYLGKELFVDWCGLILALETLTGQQFMFVTDIAARDWYGDQDVLATATAEKRTKALAEKSAIQTDLSARNAALVVASAEEAVRIGKEIDTLQTQLDAVVVPPPFTVTDPPKWMLDRSATLRAEKTRRGR